jgi:hypothetical protein
MTTTETWKESSMECPLWRLLISSRSMPCLLMNRDEMSNLYREPSKDAPTNFWFIWPSGFRGEDFLEINQSETRMACGGHVC